MRPAPSAPRSAMGALSRPGVGPGSNVEPGVTGRPKGGLDGSARLPGGAGVRSGARPSATGATGATGAGRLSPRAASRGSTAWGAGLLAAGARSTADPARAAPRDAPLDRGIEVCWARPCGEPTGAPASGDAGSAAARAPVSDAPQLGQNAWPGRTGDVQLGQRVDSTTRILRLYVRGTLGRAIPRFPAAILYVNGQMSLALSPIVPIAILTACRPAVKWPLQPRP